MLQNHVVTVPTKTFVSCRSLPQPTTELGVDEMAAIQGGVWGPVSRFVARALIGGAICEAASDAWDDVQSWKFESSGGGGGGGGTTASAGQYSSAAY